MPVVYHRDVASEAFNGGATYQTLVGDERGSTPIRWHPDLATGLQDAASFPSLHGDDHGPRRPGGGLDAGCPRSRSVRARRYAGAEAQRAALVSGHRRSAAEDLRHSRIAAPDRERP